MTAAPSHVMNAGADASRPLRHWKRLGALNAGDRWFAVGLRLFGACAVIAALAVGILWLPQMRVLAAIALVQAVLGVGVCMWGLHAAARPTGAGSAERTMARGAAAAHAATCSVSQEASCPTFSTRSI